MAGAGNPAADAASRLLLDILESLARQLRVRLIRLPVLQECVTINNTVLAKVRARGKLVVRRPWTRPPEPLPHAALQLLTVTEQAVQHANNAQGHAVLIYH